MTSKVTSIGLKGLEGYKVSVEVRTMQGTEAFVIVGLPDASVKESKERVTAALHGMGYTLVNQKVYWKELDYLRSLDVHPWLLLFIRRYGSIIIGNINIISFYFLLVPSFPSASLSKNILVDM